jgi:hypothetical protein
LLLLGRGRRFDAIGRNFPELTRELAIKRAWIAAGACGDLRRKERRRDAVLVGCPDCSVSAQECGSRAFLAAKAQRSVEQPVDEPFEADGTSYCV